MKWMHWIAAALAAVPLIAGAQDFAGKTVTIVVGYKAGGGYDATARLLARYLPKHIPGKPTVIVQNMPGANSIIAANHMYNVAKPDGLTIGTFNRNLPIAQLTNVQGVKYDITKFQWIGSAANETTVLAIRSDLPYKNFDELRKAKERLVIGSTGPGANTHDFPLLLKDLLGMNIKIVSGYSSSADIMLAVERKEVDGRAGSYSSLKTFFDRKLVKPIVRARSNDKTLAALPLDEDFAPNPRAKAIMALRSAPEQVSRPYVLPPATPANIVQAMRKAFEAAIKDPDCEKEAAKAQLDLEFTPGDEAQKILAGVLKQPKDIVEEFSKYIKFGE
jgi:tripartite-type tricarboxylate transporter receptor subunit TctC